MINFLKNYKTSYLIVIILCLSSFYLGYVYSYFNTDIHHYSHNLETFLDFKNGFELNKDILQYSQFNCELLSIIYPTNKIGSNMAHQGASSAYGQGIRDRKPERRRRQDHHHGESRRRSGSAGPARVARRPGPAGQCLDGFGDRQTGAGTQRVPGAGGAGFGGAGAPAFRIGPL